MGEKNVKYEYEYGLCKRMHYRGLWCVRYEGEPGHFEKAGMACSCAVDGCDKDCAVLESADAVIDPEWEWHMIDTPPSKYFAWRRQSIYVATEPAAVVDANMGVLFG